MLNKESKLKVICGGFSQERDVSLRSGKNVYEALIRLGYTNSELIDLDSMDKLDLIQSENTELAILMTHGEFGEDGQLQSLLDSKKIKYTGSSAQASANCMDKVITKVKLKAAGLPVLETYKAEDILNKKVILEGPIILKEINGGSSVGVTMYESQEAFIESEARGLKLEGSGLNNYFIERFVKGIELTASIIKLEGKLTCLPLLELRSKNQFYDYEAKYTKGMTEFILPAQISDELTNKIKAIALEAYQAMQCSGPARVDFIIEGDDPYILELNTLPGMTDTSDLPAQAKAAGIDYDELIEILIHSCRHESATSSEHSQHNQ